MQTFAYTLELQGSEPDFSDAKTILETNDLAEASKQFVLAHSHRRLLLWTHSAESLGASANELIRV